MNPPCGTPGACCDDATADCYIEFQANCPGRFVAGAECDPDPFDPPCGEWTCTGILYAPSNPDTGTFRADVTAITGQPCDFWDASASTPTLDDIKDYCCVFTWGNYAYADPVGFGDVLAAFVDQGGKVILGQWTYHSDQSNWLEGAIMTPAYCPVTVSTSFGSGAYMGDGIDCVHVLGPVSAYDTTYLDIATAITGAVTDGTFETGSLAVAWRPIVACTTARVIRAQVSAQVTGRSWSRTCATALTNL